MDLALTAVTKAVCRVVTSYGVFSYRFWTHMIMVPRMLVVGQSLPKQSESSRIIKCMPAMLLFLSLCSFTGLYMCTRTYTCMLTNQSFMRIRPICHACGMLDSISFTAQGRLWHLAIEWHSDRIHAQHTVMLTASPLAAP